MTLYFNQERAFILVCQPSRFKLRMTQITDELNKLLPEWLQIESCEQIMRYDDEVEMYAYCWLFSTCENELISNGEWNKVRDVIIKAWNVFYENNL